MYEDFPDGIEYLQFFGGEPLLAKEQIMAIVSETEAISKEKGVAKPVFGIVTNGVLLNLDFATYCAKHDIRVTISVDGPQTIHDAIRVNCSNSGTYKSVVDALESCKNIIGFKKYGEMTINKVHIINYKPGIVATWLDEMSDIGLNSGTINIVDDSFDKTYDVREADIEILESIFEEIAEYMFDIILNQKENMFLLNGFVETIVMLLGNRKKEHTSCGPGLYQYTITADGKVMPCTYFMEDKYRIGNVTDSLWRVVEYVPDAEIWDLYDENRELLGKDHVRGEQLPIGGYHLVVHVWIRNSKGEYLISQRSANRPTFPLMWECVGGSVVKGEDSLQGAIREVKEEVGVDLKPESGQVLFTNTRKIIEGKIFNDILDVWLFEYDGEVDLSNATTDEVAQVAWMNREQIKELFEHNMFVETLEYFFMEVDKERR